MMKNQATVSARVVTANSKRVLMAVCVFTIGSVATWAQPPAVVVAIENSPQAKTDAEKKILEVLDDLDKNQRSGPLVRPGGLVLGHNMHQPAPSEDYVKAITANPDLETVFLNMHAAGIAATLKKR